MSSAITAGDRRCPNCDASGLFAFFRRNSVPVHQNLLHRTAESARTITRGNLDLQVCGACGFVFNAAFQPDLLDYGAGYEDTKTYSTAFNSHLDRMIGRMEKAEEVRAGLIVEVGCGTGYFLKRLLVHQGNESQGIGFDPAYIGPEHDLEGRVRFARRLYGAETGIPAQVVVCRHVLEHVVDPTAMLRSIRSAFGSTAGPRLYIETPCVDWVLRHQVSWDLYYEHCSMFTSGSLAELLARTGFAVTDVQKTFGDQYLWVEATTGDGPHRPATGHQTIMAARHFGMNETKRVARWNELLQRDLGSGPVAVWGAAAKGVTFCNLLDPDGRRISCVVDMNPAKQGNFVAGTGHRILAPDELSAAGVKTVIVLNPIYLEEITAELTRVNSSARVVDWMARSNN